MAIKPILKMGDPRLQRVSESVTAFNCDELNELIIDMFDTMQANLGAGLAAPQIGVLKRVVIFGAEQKPEENGASSQPNPRYPGANQVPLTILINPQIEILSSTSQSYWEGCLSLPGLRGLVTRPDKIRYSGFDQHGQAFTREVSGFHAIVVQHECDHLDGILYPMRMQDMSQFGFAEELSQAELNKKSNPVQE